jgi:small subunit ribosomal protein S14
MKNQIQKDKNKRNLSLKFENKCIILKSIAKNNNITKTTRWNSELKLTDLNANSYKSRLVNRCVLTGRKSKSNGAFRFSRLSFLKFARNGLIAGLKKSVR